MDQRYENLPFNVLKRCTALAESEANAFLASENPSTRRQGKRAAKKAASMHKEAARRLENVVAAILAEADARDVRAYAGRCEVSYDAMRHVFTFVLYDTRYRGRVKLGHGLVLPEDMTCTWVHGSSANPFTGDYPRAY